MGIKRISLEELRAELAATRVTRGIQEVVLHHTWSPTAAQYQGPATWEGIRDYHVGQRGWSDIGYHYGVGPDGSIWRLRPVTRAGAHVLNRNRHTVGVVLLGNYDVEDPVKHGLGVVAQVVRVVCERFKLKAGQIRFHREFQDKTCPGKRIELADFRNLVLSGQSSAARSKPQSLKVVLLPANQVINCRPALEEGVVRCDLRALAEALGAEVTDHIGEQGKVYVKK